MNAEGVAGEAPENAPSAGETAASNEREASGAEAEENVQRHPVPVLGAFAIADAEINVAVPPPSRRRDAQAQQDRSRRRGRQKERPGFKPVASLGAVMGLMAAGPFGALAGAAASLGLSKKDNLAGDTVRTAAKAAETVGEAVWDATSKAASAANVEEFVQRGVDTVDNSINSFKRNKE